MKLKVIKNSVAGNLWVNCRINTVKRNFTIKNALVLEIGSAEGNYVSDIFKKDNKIIYSDLNFNLLSKILGPKLCLDACGLPVKKQSIDCIICADVLEHIQDDKETLKEFRRVLKKNGTLLLVLPAYSELYSSNQIKIGHFRRYDKSPTMKLLNEVGFKVNKIKYSASWHFFAMILIQVFFDETKFYGERGQSGVKEYNCITKSLIHLLIWVDQIFNNYCGISIIVMSEKANKNA